MKLPATKFRLAPTPSGFIHKGNAINFILTTALCSYHQGELLLRIDDLDQSRFREEYLNDIYAQLQFLLPKKWFEMAMDNRIFQHQRINRYREIIDQLKRNDLVFACECTRKKINTLTNNINQYPGFCSSSTIDFEQKNIAWRIKTSNHIPSFFNLDKEKQVQTTEKIGKEMVILQKNRIPAYLLASVCDDYDLGITHIIRGKDLLESSFMQQTIKDICQKVKVISSHWEPYYFHHELILDERNNKLSKSAGSQSLQQIIPSKTTKNTLIDKCIELILNSSLSYREHIKQQLISWKNQ